MPESLELESASIRSVVVAVTGADSTGTPQRFLGTGSVVGDGSILLTADHVTRDWPGPLAIVVITDNEPRPFAISLIERDSAHDLALFRIDKYRPANPLHIEFDEPAKATDPLMAYEYGTTLVTGAGITLNPAMRLGHMTRRVDLEDGLGPAGRNALELSFPALRGASGAPVMFNDVLLRSMLGKRNAGIVGVIVANASHHLLPAQIESVLDEKNNLYEEVRYLLPQAIAVDIQHLRPMYERANR